MCRWVAPVQHLRAAHNLTRVFHTKERAVEGARCQERGVSLRIFADYSSTDEFCSAQPCRDARSARQHWSCEHWKSRRPGTEPWTACGAATARGGHAPRAGSRLGRTRNSQLHGLVRTLCNGGLSSLELELPRTYWLSGWGNRREQDKALTISRIVFPTRHLVGGR